MFCRVNGNVNVEYSVAVVVVVVSEPYIWVQDQRWQ